MGIPDHERGFESFKAFVRSIEDYEGGAVISGGPDNRAALSVSINLFRSQPLSGVYSRVTG